MKRVVVVVVLVVAAACSKDDRVVRTDRDPDPTPPRPVVVDAPVAAADADPSLIVAPRPAPPGPYVVTYDCSHSNMPFGKGGAYRNQAADLEHRTWTILDVTYSGEELPPDKAPPPPKPTTSAMSAGAADTLAAAIARVFAAGPYRPEYPVPEGTPCKLTISAGGQAVFAIDKAATTQHDAVSDLVMAFADLAGQ